MSDWYDDYEWSIEDHPGFAEAAADWAADNFEELQAEYAESDLATKMIAAHKTIWPSIEEALSAAAARLGENNANEAVFYLARAFEGYVRGSYLNPVIEQMLVPFEARRKQVVIEILDFTGPALTGRTPQRLLLFAAVGITNGMDEARGIASAVSNVINGAGPWKLRNRVFHTAYDAPASEAQSLQDLVKKGLEVVAHPLFERIAEENAALEEARKRTEGMIFPFLK